ncbi:hypothetical protein CRG98_021158 [Punica granatum]|uniref:Uncharacterized protein n=1 Tax=Punica granatum TaxID=22663 RepID=A0A2I0JRE5_PUNGR|nr:hypothetical protein CRG98_021158 [Punica granatum]
MAPIGGSPPTKKCRQRTCSRKKLRVNDRVEVKSEEDGFLGSWHQGIVLACGHRRRCIKYDHILIGGTSDSMIEHVEVSPAVDGIDFDQVHRCHYRGSIRPLPPYFVTGPWDLPYGMCVDVYHMDAWWEGVIFDHNDGAEERTIFFPDLGNEIEVWQDLNLETISENLKVALSDALPHLVVMLGNIGQSVDLLNDVPEMDEGVSKPSGIDETIKLLNNDPSKIDVQVSQTTHNSDPLTEEAEPDNNGMICDRMSRSANKEPSLSISQPEMLNESSRHCSMVMSAEVPSRLSSEMDAKSKDLTCRKRGNWQPAGPDLVPRAEHFPDAIAFYIRGKGTKHNESLVADVQKHLLYLDWKIEFRFDKEDVLRFRYVSPEGKCYQSLVKACLDIIGTNMDNLSDANKSSAATINECQSSHTLDKEDHEKATHLRRLKPDKNVSASRPWKSPFMHKKRMREWEIQSSSSNGRSNNTLGSICKLDGAVNSSKLSHQRNKTSSLRKSKAKASGALTGGVEDVEAGHQTPRKFQMVIGSAHPVVVDSATKVSIGLYKLIGKPVQLDRDNLTWTLLKSMKFNPSDPKAHDIEAITQIEYKLDVVVGMMHECFELVREPSTQRDLVEDVIFSRGIFGDKVVEVPLVGTRSQYRRLGMCRLLMNELENKLKELGVYKLVLPATPSVLDTWTTSFGFTKMIDSERLQFLGHTFLNFQDTVMCHKRLLEIPQRELNSNIPTGKAHEVCDGDANKSGGDSNDLGGSVAVSEDFGDMKRKMCWRRGPGGGA